MYKELNEQCNCKYIVQKTKKRGTKNDRKKKMSRSRDRETVE